MLTKRSRRRKRTLLAMLTVVLALSGFIMANIPDRAHAESADTYYVSHTGDDSGNTGLTIDDPFQTIAKAFAEIGAAGSIVLLSDITLTATLNLSGNKQVAITSADAGKYSIIRGEGFTDKMIQATTGSPDITLDNVIIDGSGIEVDVGDFIGAAIYGDAAGVKIELNHVEMIHHKINSTHMIFMDSGSLLVIDEGTVIHQNTLVGYQQGVPPALLGSGQGGRIELKDGEISDNTVEPESNGVIVAIGSANIPTFNMTGGQITGNHLNGQEIVEGESRGNVAVFMRGNTDNSRYEFGGTAYVYDNVNQDGEQRNVYLANTTSSNAYLTLVSPLQNGAKIGVYAKTMPSAGGFPQILVAKGFVDDGTPIYTATVTDAVYFVSDKATSAEIQFDSDNDQVILASIPPLLDHVWLDQSADNGATLVYFVFNDEIELTDAEDFTILVGGLDVTAGTDFTVDPEDARRLIVTLQDRPTADFELAYDNGNSKLKGVNGMPVDHISFTYAIDFADGLAITTPTGDPAQVSVPRPTIAGTVEAGSTVEVIIKDENGNVVEEAGGTATVDGDGNWEFTPAEDLETGAYTIEVTSTKGNQKVTKTKTLDVVEVDKTFLEAEVELSDTLNEADYSEASWGNYLAKWTAAQGVLSDEEATQDEVDTALEQLEAAREALTVDKTLLEAKVDEVNGEDLVEGDYAPSLWSAFAAALTAAQDVLGDEEATQAEVNDALAALTAAREALDAAGEGLVTLTPGSGTLSPAFATTTYAYTLNVANNVSQLPLAWESSLEPVIVTMTVNGQAIDGTTAPLVVGANTVKLMVVDDSGTQTYTITVWRAGPAVPIIPGPSGPQSEEFLVPVETGAVLEGQVVEQTPIKRIKEAGNVRDEVTLTHDRALRAIENARNANQDTVRVIIPDDNDEVGQVDFTLPDEARNELAQTNTNLEIYTENARLLIPGSSLDGFTEDLYFQLVPVKEEAERNEVEDRAQFEIMMRGIAGEQDVKLVARPMTIETNLQSRPVTLILPLGGVELPTDAAEREQFLASLFIYVEHSDGEKQIVYPQVVAYQGQELGLQFSISKFSTFTIVSLEGWQDNFHTAYVRGYPDGTFRPEAAVTRAEMAAMLAPNLGFHGTANGPGYPDVASAHWAAAAIEYMRTIGLMVGDTDGNFRPGATISRAEMAAIVARHKQLADQQAGFPDVPPSHWAAGAIGAVEQSGILVGHTDGTYKPSASVTRAEAVKAVNLLFERGPLYGGTTTGFSDVPVTHWAYNDIEEARQDHLFIPRAEGGEHLLDVQ